MNSADLNAAAVQGLAREVGPSCRGVQRMYEKVLEHMKKGATIRTFLPIFVNWHVREQLR
jgi:hypothetical protein